MMDDIEVHFELQGWTLFFARLEITMEAAEAMAAVRAAAAATARSQFELAGLASHPTVAALRKLFRAAGCDPTRYRPSSEALLRRVLKGAELPAINPLVDINNCLSLSLAVPCCVMAEETVGSPYRFRSGRTGESYESLKGPFHLEGKPLLVDVNGPCDVPITGSRRVMIRDDTHRAVLVAYLPRDMVAGTTARRELKRLLGEAPVARLLGSCNRPAESEEAQQDQDR
jgi:DNA/RNA-binding domain of Phe-tRNA-synthetase-like protein